MGEPDRQENNGGGERIGTGHGRWGVRIVSRHETYEAPKSGFRAVSKWNPGTRWSFGCTGARTMARQESANLSQ